MATVKPHEPKLGWSVLIGTGDRVVKLGFVQINIYSLGLYVDPDSCRTVLVDFSGLDHNGLLCHPEFYPAFVAGQFQKTFCLTFCRSLGREKLVGGFEGPLRSRCDKAHSKDAELLLANLVPESGIADNDVLTMVCDADGQTLTATYMTAATGKETELLQIESGGAGGAWLAFQNMFFDTETTVPTIRQSAVADLPNVLQKEDASSSMKARQPSQKEIEEAVEQDFVKGGTAGNWRKAETWSEFAGRNPAKGGEGYKFGDFTLGVVTAMGMRKPSSGSSDGEQNKKSVRAADSSSIDNWRQRVEDIQAVNSQIQSELASTKGILFEVERTQPAKVICALVISEVLGFVFGHIMYLSTGCIFAVKILFYAIGGVMAWFHYQRAGAAVKKKTS